MVAHPRISVTTISSWSWTMEQDVAFLKQQGVAAMGVPMTKFTDAIEAEIATARDSGLHITAVSGAPEGSLVESEEASLAALKPAIDAAHGVGCEAMYFLSGVTPPRMPTDEACAALIANLGKAKAYADGKSVSLAIEHNSISSRDMGFVHTLEAVAEVTSEAGLGICVELQNCWYETGLKQLFCDNAGRFTVVQVSDFLVGETLKYNRRVPGDGSMPLEWLLGLALEAGYDGYFEIEVLGPAIEEEGYEPAILRSIDWLGERLERWGV